MAKKIELWVSEDGHEFETEAECLDYEQMLAYSKEIVEDLLKKPGAVEDAKHIVDALWEKGYMVVKREISPDDV